LKGLDVQFTGGDFNTVTFFLQALFLTGFTRFSGFFMTKILPVRQGLLFNPA
jgi:hypothetical protein